MKRLQDIMKPFCVNAYFWRGGLRGIMNNLSEDLSHLVIEVFINDIKFGIK